MHCGPFSIITGQSPIRTGLTKVGVPGADLGIRPEDVTLATLLKEQGYATGQFGKNHLGDRDEFHPPSTGLMSSSATSITSMLRKSLKILTTRRIRLFGNFGPRGVVHSFADGRVTDTGPLNKKRMETVDLEFLDTAQQFIQRAAEEDKPFFVWFNSTRMHFWTHTPEEEKGLSGQGFYNDAMVGHDNLVGRLSISSMSWVSLTTRSSFTALTMGRTSTPGQMPPSRPSEAKKIPTGRGLSCAGDDPLAGQDPAGTILNDMMSHEDWVPTLMSAAGRPTVTEELKAGVNINGRDYHNHLDGTISCRI